MTALSGWLVAMNETHQILVQMWENNLLCSIDEGIVVVATLKRPWYLWGT